MYICTKKLVLFDGVEEDTNIIAMVATSKLVCLGSM